APGADRTGRHQGAPAAGHGRAHLRARRGQPGPRPRPRRLARHATEDHGPDGHAPRRRTRLLARSNRRRDPLAAVARVRGAPRAILGHPGARVSPLPQKPRRSGCGRNRPNAMVMCARLVSTLVAVGLLVSGTARAFAAGDEPESGAAATAPGGAVAAVEPVETTTVQGAPAVEAAPPKPIPQLDERTAYMVGRHRLKLGILAFEYGILQQLSIGTEPPAWILRAFINILLPNLHPKYQLLERDPVAVAVMAAGYYATLDRSN